MPGKAEHQRNDLPDLVIQTHISPQTKEIPEAS